MNEIWIILEHDNSYIYLGNKVNMKTKVIICKLIGFLLKTTNENY